MIEKKNDIPIKMFRIYYLILRKTYSNKYKQKMQKKIMILESISMGNWCLISTKNLKCVNKTQRV